MSPWETLLQTQRVIFFQTQDSKLICAEILKKRVIACMGSNVSLHMGMRRCVA